MLQTKNPLVNRPTVIGLGNPTGTVIVSPVHVSSPVNLEPIVAEISLTQVSEKQSKGRAKRMEVQDFLDELRDMVEAFDKGKPIRYDYEVKADILGLYKKYGL